jgi:hypothetical protein
VYHLALVVFLLLQHATTIRDSQLCRFLFEDVVEEDTTMCLWMGQHLITWKPTGFYSSVSTRDCLKFCELKYRVVTATKVVGKHSHPNLCGWAH